MTANIANDTRLTVMICWKQPLMMRCLRTGPCQRYEGKSSFFFSPKLHSLAFVYHAAIAEDSWLCVRLQERRRRDIGVKRIDASLRANSSGATLLEYEEERQTSKGFCGTVDRVWFASLPRLPALKYRGQSSAHEYNNE